jgi:ring-1,2-phenylacetyl-CoA epoxidase subunit PaaC
MEKALFHYLLRLGDDSVVLGHRLAEWCSKAPLLEEDLALTNISLDHIGRALSLFEYAAEVEGKGRTADNLVYTRGERHYYNHLLVEQPNGDFAHTMVRQLFFSTYDFLVCMELSKSTDSRLSGIFQKGIKEATYHRNHAAHWILRLGCGTDESRRRVLAGIEAMWPYIGDLFEMHDHDRLLLQLGVSCDLHTLRLLWEKEVAQYLQDAGLVMPTQGYQYTGSNGGVHTEHLGHMLSEMQFLVRAYPDAVW